jgi:hypothetical protein
VSGTGSPAWSSGHLLPAEHHVAAERQKCALACRKPPSPSWTRRVGGGFRPTTSPTSGTLSVRFNQVKFESETAREHARRRLLTATKRHGIVPVGFITGQLVTERQEGESQARVGSEWRTCGFFGADQALDISTDRIRTYIQSRLEAEAAAGTVNRDLEACSTGTTSVSPADLREVARRLTPSDEPR